MTTSNSSPKPKRAAKTGANAAKPAARAKPRDQTGGQHAVEAPAPAVVAPAAKAPRPARVPRKPAITTLPDADPPETVGKLAGEYIGLTIAGGMIAGVLIGAMLPRLAFGRWFRRGGALAVIAGEIGTSLATQAIGRSGAAASESRERIVDFGGNLGSTIIEGSAVARESAVKLAERAGHALDGLDVAGSIRHAAEESSARARGAGAALARKAVDLVAKTRG